MKLPTIQTGPIVRTRTMEQQRIKHTRSIKSGCDFCNFSSDSDQFVREYDHFWLVTNIFPYAIWDGCRVEEHLLLSPKRHVTSLSELTPIESSEYIQIIGKADGDGYTIFTRPDGSAGKSVPHQHTHFIRIDNVRIKSLYYNYAPHVLWYK